MRKRILLSTVIILMILAVLGAFYTGMNKAPKAVRTTGVVEGTEVGISVCGQGTIMM